MKKKNLWIPIFIMPTFLLFLLVYGVSLVMLSGTSLTRWRTGSPIEFLGVRNYLELFVNDSNFHQALINTLVWILLQSTVHVVIGLLFALILARKEFYWKFARTVYMIPNIISSAALGMLFLFILNPDIGAVNGVIRLAGLKDFSQNWLMDYTTSFFAMTMTWLPYAAVVTILILSELAAIPESVLEAARIDGASRFRTNLHVVIPMLRNILGTCVILSSTSMLQKLDIILMTTDGGPGNNTLNLPLFIYKTALTENNFGYANAAGVIMVCMGIALVLMYSRLFRLGKSHY